jgi:hypothetical protein
VSKPSTNTMSVRQYASAGLMVNEQNSHLGFPDGVQFVPYVFFRNLAAQLRTIHVTAYYAEGNTNTATKSLPLPDVTLQPGQAQELDIRDAMKSRPQIQDINLLFSYTGDYGDILAATGSTDGTGNYVFPVMPQAVGPSGPKASMYWEVANGFDTMYTIWNPTSIPQELVAILRYGKSGEKFTLPLHLNEYASAMIDIGELIRTQQADQDQNVLPQDTHEGSLEVGAVTTQPEDLATFVLAGGIYNPRKATCGYTCETCWGVTDYGIDPGSFLIPMSQSHQGQFYYQLATGGRYTSTSSTHWNSGNTSVATVPDMGQPNPGLVAAVGTGNTTIGATYIATLPGNVRQICSPPPLPLCPTQGGWTGQSPETTQIPTSLNLVKSPTILQQGTGLQHGCPPGYYGIMIDVDYQVLDQTGAPIANTNMEPQENVPGVTQGYQDIGPSGSDYPQSAKFTRADGTFDDVPLGTCLPVPVTTLTAWRTQSIQVLLNGTAYPVRTNSWSYKTTNLPNQGTLTNGKDINATQ